MIKLNLLPARYKTQKRRKVAPEKKTVLLLSMGVGVFLILTLSGFSLFQQIKLKKERERLAKTEELRILEPLYKDEVTLTKNEIDTLKPKLAVIDNLVARRRFWSKKMNQVSWLLPEKIWLTNVEVQEKEEVVNKKVGNKVISEKTSKSFLMIKGSAVSLEGEERLQAIANFMATLKGNKRFFADYFEDLKFVSCSSREIGDFDVMDFIFELSLKQK